MDPSSIILPSSLQNAAMLTIFLAFAGYLLTFSFTRMMAGEATGCALSTSASTSSTDRSMSPRVAGNIAYSSLLKKQGKTQCHPIRDEDLKEWMLWMTTIFMPLNDVREKIIIENAHLIVEERCRTACSTSSPTWWATRRCWPSGQMATTPRRRSTIGWPPEFDIYVERSYNALKAEQTRLLHSGLWRLYHRLAEQQTKIACRSIRQPDASPRH